MSTVKILHKIREATGAAVTTGLTDEQIQSLEKDFPEISEAAKCAEEEFNRLQSEFGELLKKPEMDLIKELQKDIINFYPEAQTNPYISLSAKGPWLITSHGALLHDSGGYGMLGLGHDPVAIKKAMGKNQVMANVMTANFSQLRCTNLLNKEIGHTRKQRPYSKYIFMNSGSESVTVASRICDVLAKKNTDPDGMHAGKTIKLLGNKGGFHGRTDRPAQVSSSSLKNYQVLASFRDRHNLETVLPNDVSDLEKKFKWAEDNNVYFEAFFIEPVMGEGDPGKAMTRQYYDKARELTKKMNTLLIVDSIQAAIRATGCLSICDYPGFEDCEAPDMETYSKAVNAGQYPLSILALTDRAADLYIRGIYGNTMTTNPRSLDVACAVLEGLTPEFRQNIRDRGIEFLEKLNALKEETGDIITDVQGTGLLFSAAINPKIFKVVGFDDLEVYLRRHGIGVIHGGENALRFTPHFRITSKEVDLIIESMRDAFKNAPRVK